MASEQVPTNALGIAPLVAPTGMSREEVLKYLKDTPITAMDAFHVMRRLLADYYIRMEADQIGDILSETAIVQDDGIPMDAAWLFEWLAALRAVQQGDLAP